MKKEYIISLCGQEAVDIAYNLCEGKCYWRLPTYGQMEVVIDEPGYYNGLPMKWVSIYGIPNGKCVEVVLRNLSMVGFAGMYALIGVEEIDGCAEETDMCCVKV